MNDDGASSGRILEFGQHTVRIVEDDLWVERSADFLAASIVAAVTLRQKCVLALSGGSTPAPVFRSLAGRPIPWHQVVITQVDERIAPVGHHDRNLTIQQRAFDGLPVTWVPLEVDDVDPIKASAAALTAAAGSPPIPDVVHLGLGADGHTASLVPDDPVLDVDDRLLGVTEPYEGRQRITFTKPLLDRSRLVIWLVRGEDKAEALAQLVAGDPSIPASRLTLGYSLIVADPAAASALGVG